MPSRFERFSDAVKRGIESTVGLIAICLFMLCIAFAIIGLVQANRASDHRGDDLTHIIAANQAEATCRADSAVRLAVAESERGDANAALDASIARILLALVRGDPAATQAEARNLEGIAAAIADKTTALGAARADRTQSVARCAASGG